MLCDTSAQSLLVKDPLIEPFLKAMFSTSSANFHSPSRSSAMTRPRIASLLIFARSLMIRFRKMSIACSPQPPLLDRPIERNAKSRETGWTLSKPPPHCHSDPPSDGFDVLSPYTSSAVSYCEQSTQASIAAATSGCPNLSAFSLLLAYSTHASHAPALPSADPAANTSVDISGIWMKCVQNIRTISHLVS